MAQESFAEDGGEEGGGLVLNLGGMPHICLKDRTLPCLQWHTTDLLIHCGSALEVSKVCFKAFTVAILLRGCWQHHRLLLCRYLKLAPAMSACYRPASSPSPPPSAPSPHPTPLHYAPPPLPPTPPLPSSAWSTMTLFPPPFLRHEDDALRREAGEARMARPR